MSISDRGLALIKEHEGLRLTAYPDPASGDDPWTIGYGHTQGVKRGQTITEAQATDFLREDLYWVEQCIRDTVRVSLSQNQYDALCSLIFNIGAGAFTRSTLLRLLNDGNYAGAAAEFVRWNMAAGKPMPGLTKRRAQERALFVEAAAPSPAPIPAPVAPIPAAPAPNHYAPAGEADAPEQQEKPMLPFIAAGLSALIQNAPALIRVFGDSPQAEKNAKAAEVVAGIAQQVTGQSTVEGAVRAIEASPDVAAQYREAVHKSMTAGELLQVLVAAGEADDKSRGLALDRNLQLASATGGRWLWLLGAVVIVVIVASLLITCGVLFWKGSTFSDETKALLLGQIVIFGFVTCLQFLTGSNIQNRISQRDKQERGE